MEYTIYKIVCNDPNITSIYVGFTKDFKRRLAQHKCVSKRGTDKRKLYTFIRDNGTFSNFKMEQIDTFVGEITEAREREKHYFELLKADLNDKHPNQTKRENFVKNKEYYQEWHRNYQKENQEHIRDQHQAYYKNNKEKWDTYRLANKEKINERKKEKTTCSVCNCEINKNHLSRHNRTNKHKKNITLL